MNGSLSWHVDRGALAYLDGFAGHPTNGTGSGFVDPLRVQNAATTAAPAYAIAEILEGLASPHYGSNEDHTARRFACFRGCDLGVVGVGVLPQGLASVRDALLMPEGPLVFDLPRPDSSENAFCHTCHAVDAASSALPLAALAAADIPVQDDPRRQPMQPPARVFGHVPAGWLDPSLGDMTDPAGWAIGARLLRPWWGAVGRNDGRAGARRGWGYLLTLMSNESVMLLSLTSTLGDVL